MTGLEHVAPQPLDVFQTRDRFDTINNFYGGQLGARAEYRMGAFFVAARGTVALGNMHESVEINGATTTDDTAAVTRLVELHLRFHTYRM